VSATGPAVTPPAPRVSFWQQWFTTIFWSVAGVVVATLFVVQWWQDRLVDVPSTVRWSQQAEKQMFAEHVCSAPRDGVPGLDHYAVIRTWMGDKIAWVELATPDFNRRVELSEGNAGEKDWYVIGLCRR
jgi:hypothetical protein